MPAKKGSGERIFEAECEYGEDAVKRALKEACSISPYGLDADYAKNQNRKAHQKLSKANDLEAAGAFEVIFILPDDYFDY